ncbi:DUF4870 domain-containing protein [Lysinibacillus sp. 54212]|uniref:DUF4870 domain-containing protein n=1 Tax=Lysinibacillus sp. 54212 TaxID=3119829 RepID=UPI002FC9E649
MESKWLKVILHASAFFAPLLVPLFIFLISTEEEVKRLSIQALLFQGVMWLLVAISAALIIVLIGIPFLMIFSIMGIVVPIIGIIKAINETPWNYPIVGRWV